jgi:hypothetical protein
MAAGVSRQLEDAHQEKIMAPTQGAKPNSASDAAIKRMKAVKAACVRPC